MTKVARRWFRRILLSRRRPKDRFERSRRLAWDESGWIGTMEFVILSTIVVFGLIVGLAMYRNALVQEYGDLSAALLHLDQSFSINGDGFEDSIPNYATMPAGGIDVTVPPAPESF